MAIPEIFERLHRARARYVLVGATALLLHGAEILFTEDVDLAITLLPEDRDAILSAFADVNPHPPRAHGSVPWDKFSIRSPWTKIVTDIGEIDLLVTLPGVEDGFEGMYRRSLVFEIDDLPYRIACLDDLAAMKAASVRPKDGQHLEMIRQLQQLAVEETKVD